MLGYNNVTARITVHRMSLVQWVSCATRLVVLVSDRLWNRWQDRLWKVQQAFSRMSQVSTETRLLGVVVTTSVLAARGDALVGRLWDEIQDQLGVGKRERARCND